MIKRWRYLLASTVLILVLVGGLSYKAYSRALPMLQPVANANKVGANGTPQIIWSPYGEQSITVMGHPELTQSYGATNELPTASIGKVVTALAILKQKPLSVGQQGPSMTIDDNDVDVYQQDLAQNQSVVEVTAGEQMTEYQALEAMLVPSATNIADIAAPWAFGSMNAFLTYANQYVSGLGMTNTHIGDASGFSPSTVSTPQDLTQLGEIALQNPVIAQIVSQHSVNLPVAGTVDNFNIDVGQDGITGIKTGNTDQAGGALLFSATHNGMTIIGAIMGAPDLGTALHDAPEVLDSYTSNIGTATAIKAGDVVGHYTLPWGGSVNAVAQKDISTITWNGTKLATTISLQPIKATQNTKQQVGQVSVAINGGTQTTPVMIAQGPTQPSFWWRLSHH